MVALFGRALGALARGTDFDRSHLMELLTALSLLGAALGGGHGGDLGGQVSSLLLPARRDRGVMEMTDADVLFRRQNLFSRLEHCSSSIKTLSLPTPFQENRSAVRKSIYPISQLLSTYLREYVL